MSTLGVYLVEVKAARERRWPPPSYAGPRNVRVLTPHDPTTIRLWEYLYLFFYSNIPALVVDLYIIF